MSPGGFTRVTEGNAMIRRIPFRFAEGCVAAALVVVFPHSIGGQEAPPNCCGENLNVSFSDHVIRAGVPHSEPTAGPNCLHSGGEAVRFLRPGETGCMDIYVNMISDYETSYGLYGWALSIELQGEAEVTAAVKAGAALSEDDGGYASHRPFDNTKLAAPSRNEGRKGAVSGFLLDLGGDSNVLPGMGTETVLKLTICDGPLGGESISKLRLLDGLMGTGGPVTNEGTYLGARAPYCNRDYTDFTIRFVPTNLELARFVRADSNTDGEVDISDAIFTLSELFGGGRLGACENAADANDDGKVDISDSIFTLSHLFGDGRAPSAPHLDCGEDPTEDDLGCLGPTPCG